MQPTEPTPAPVVALGTRARPPKTPPAAGRLAMAGGSALIPLLIRVSRWLSG